MQLLTNNEVKNATACEKPYKLNDGAGLYVLVTPAGGKLWNYRYTIDGKEKKLAIGQYPDVTLKAARDARDDARQLLREGRDPSADKRQVKTDQAAARQNTFAHFAKGTLERALMRTPFASTQKKWRLHMRYAVAAFGDRPIADITRLDVLDFLRTFEARGQVSSMHSIKWKIHAVFEDALDAEACAQNPARIDRARLKPLQHERRPAITDPARFGQLLRAIDKYDGNATTIALLKLSALCFQRPAEMAGMRWDEVDLDAALWSIPAERMKKVGNEARPQLVPLSRQAVQVLREIQLISGGTPFVFPNHRGTRKPASLNTAQMALRRLEFGEEMSAHGFRASAQTLIKERVRFPAWVIDRNEVIERQLSHVQKSEVTRAYDRSHLIEARTWLMQAWADYCDTMRVGADVVPIGGQKIA